MRFDYQMNVYKRFVKSKTLDIQDILGHRNTNNSRIYLRLILTD